VNPGMALVALYHRAASKRLHAEAGDEVPGVVIRVHHYVLIIASAVLVPEHHLLSLPDNSPFAFSFYFFELEPKRAREFFLI